VAGRARPVAAHPWNRHRRIASRRVGRTLQGGRARRAIRADNGVVLGADRPRRRRARRCCASCTQRVRATGSSVTSASTATATSRRRGFTILQVTGYVAPATGCRGSRCGRGTRDRRPGRGSQRVRSWRPEVALGHVRLPPEVVRMPCHSSDARASDGKSSRERLIRDNRELRCGTRRCRRHDQTRRGGAFASAPKRTRTSTRLSRTRPSNRVKRVRHGGNRPQSQLCQLARTPAVAADDADVLTMFSEALTRTAGTTAVWRTQQGGTDGTRYPAWTTLWPASTTTSTRPSRCRLCSARAKSPCDSASRGHGSTTQPRTGASRRSGSAHPMGPFGLCPTIFARG
jgi:hypothetical protein